MKHFKLYKPYNYLTQFVRTESNRKNKKLLGELFDFPEGTMAIGRLDEKSEGLLLLTTDGKVSEEIRSNKYEKEYYIQVDGIITPEAINKLEKGVEITVEKDGEEVDGKSIMGLMMLAAGHGSLITITTEGPQADEALKAIVELVSNDFEDK